VPVGCAFAPRCPLATEQCRTEDPVLAGLVDGDAGRVACWNPVVDAQRAEVTSQAFAGDNESVDELAGSPGGAL
jgi:hypothetical protein